MEIYLIKIQKLKNYSKSLGWMSAIALYVIYFCFKQQDMWLSGSLLKFVGLLVAQWTPIVH